MKKILSLTAMLIVFAFPSCSSDSSDGAKSTVTARIGGVDHTFNTIVVEEIPYPEDGYTDVEVTASKDANPNLRISFVIEKYEVGLDASWFFAYYLNDIFHPKVAGFQTSVTENTENRLTGTFAGQVQSSIEPSEVIDIQSGTFDIRY